MTDFDDLVDDVLEQEQKHRRALQHLLDKQRERKDHLLTIEGQMGTNRSFITSVSLEWVAQKIKFASELPLFREEQRDADKKGAIILDKETAALVQQREPDWSRQYSMVMYLTKRHTHKFPPILVVCTQDWVDDANADEWSDSDTALRDSVNGQSLDSLGRYVDLRVSVEDFLYAIDGQHRLMAIMGLRDLLSEGHLYPKDANGKEKKIKITLDEIIEQTDGKITRSDLQKLVAERIGIEIIPAVCKGETRAEALRRIRSVFVHVNRTAKPLSQGELALLDEDNGFAVVARLAMVNHELLKQRTKIKKGQLSQSSDHFTTLETLVTISENFLASDHQSWKPDTKSELPLRPDEEQIEEGYTAFMKFLDYWLELPAIKSVVDGGLPSEKRAFWIEDDKGNWTEGEAHAVFLPMMQMALAEAVGYLIKEKKRKLPAMFKILAEKEKEGLFCCVDPKSPFYGVAYDPNGEKVAKSNTKLCARILIYLLGGGLADDEDREILRQAFANSRMVDFDNEKSMNLTGKSVKSDSVKLPAPWM